jgi:chemotaxis protein MotA
LPEAAKFGRGLNAARLSAVLPVRGRTFVDLMNLFDPPSAAIVLGGTLAAVLLRCGWRDCAATAQVVAQLFARPFDSDRVRAELAVQIQEITTDGLVRAEPHRFGDGEFDELSEALIHHRSIQALYFDHERHALRRSTLAEIAGKVLSEAAELAPVLGLAGTLLSLGGLSASTVDGNYGQAIGMAVITTFYGLVAAHFLFAPLAGAVLRRADAEEEERRTLLNWLADAVDQAHPGKPKRTEPKVAA